MVEHRVTVLMDCDTEVRFDSHPIAFLISFTLPSKLVYLLLCMCRLLALACALLFSAGNYMFVLAM